MIFHAEYEFVLRATAMAIVMMAWIWVRLVLGQPVFHPWLAGFACGLLASLGGAVAVVPDSGPIPAVLAIAGALGAAMLFTAGLRYEATYEPYSPTMRVVLGVIPLALALTLEFAVPDVAMRQLLRHVLVAAALAPALLWLPGLLRHSPLRLSAIAVGIVAVGTVLDRLLPLYAPFMHTDPSQVNPVFPYLKDSDVLIILAAGAAVILFATERSRHPHARTN
jgi:hypothetical protein